VAGEAVGWAAQVCVNVRECMGARVGRWQSRRGSGRDRRRGGRGRGSKGVCAYTHV